MKIIEKFKIMGMRSVQIEEVEDGYIVADFWRKPFTYHERNRFIRKFSNIEEARKIFEMIKRGEEDGYSLNFELDE